MPAAIGAIARGTIPPRIRGIAFKVAWWTEGRLDLSRPLGFLCRNGAP